MFSVQTLPSSTIKLLPVIILSICHAPALSLDHDLSNYGCLYEFVFISSGPCHSFEISYNVVVSASTLKKVLNTSILFLHKCLRIIFPLVFWIEIFMEGREYSVFEQLLSYLESYF